MSALTDIEIDALTEIFNVGAGRAALSLSEIVGDEVQLSVPTLDVLRTREIDEHVLALASARFAAVSQIFDGPFDAEAVLLFAEAHALEIVREEYPGCFATTSSSVSPQFREFERFTTTAMNAFVGLFGSKLSSPSTGVICPPCGIRRKSWTTPSQTP